MPPRVTVSAATAVTAGIQFSHVMRGMVLLFITVICSVSSLGIIPNTYPFTRTQSAIYYGFATIRSAESTVIVGAVPEPAITVLRRI